MQQDFWCEPGDFLFYFDTPNFETRLIEVGEELEERLYKPLPYHVAVALTAYDKVEANGKATAIAPIDYNKFRVCRPPYSPGKLNGALGWARTQVGKLYGWIGIIDQCLRDLSFGYVNLPRRLVEWANNKWPYCSSLGTSIAIRGGINERLRNRGLPLIRTWPPNSPADLWAVMEQFEIERLG